MVRGWQLDKSAASRIARPRIGSRYDWHIKPRESKPSSASADGISAGVTISVSRVRSLKV
jgi:hypothetical protein